MIFRFFLILILFILSSNVFSANIRVLDFQKIINENKYLDQLYSQIDQDQSSYKEKFKIEESDLANELEKIEKLNLILDPSELQKEIDNYNIKLNDFNIKIEKFNLHYELQINDFKNKIINIILDVLKIYSEDNKIDLILDSQNYILSSNSINITNLISDQVNNKKIVINFEKY